METDGVEQRATMVKLALDAEFTNPAG